MSAIGEAGVGLGSRPARTVPCDACGASGVGVPHLDEEGREYRDKCPRCDGSGRRVVAAPFDLAVDDGERGQAWPGIDPERLAARDRLGSYHELELALEALQDRHPRCHGALMACWERLGEPGPGLQRQLAEVGLAYVDRRMPDPIRVPNGLARNAKERAAALKAVRGSRSSQALEVRDAEIRKMIRKGRPTQWVAQQFGLSVRRVNAIVQGEAEAA